MLIDLVKALLLQVGVVLTVPRVDDCFRVTGFIALKFGKLDKLGLALFGDFRM